MAKTNQLLQSLLSDADLAGLNEHFKTIELRQGEVLAEPGEDIGNVYFPHSGIVSFMVEMIDGSVVQTVMVGRDGVIGAAQALDGKKSINKIIVQVPGTASMIDRGPLQHLESGSAIRKMFAYALSPIGTFETCRRAVTMSVLRGRAKVVYAPPNRRK